MPLSFFVDHDPPDPDGPTSLDPVVVTIAEEENYANERRDQFRQLRRLTQTAWNFERVSDIDGRVNTLAEQYKDQFGDWPTSFELFAWEPFQTSISTFASGTPGLPGIFSFADDTGTQRWMVNDPINGPRFFEPSIGMILAGTGGGPEGRFLGGLGVQFIPDIQALLAGLSPIKQPTPGSGRRGAASRAPIVFDERQLANDANERWRGLLLEEPDESELKRLVQDYINDASAFWMKEGGRRDFDTFVVDRIRTTDRHSFLYDRKPGFQSEAEYLTGFRTVVGQTGINPQAGLREIEAGASSGAGLAGFGERVGRTREARLTNVGSFGNQLAQSMAASGLGRT